MLIILCQIALLSSGVRAQHFFPAALAPGYLKMHESLLEKTFDEHASLREKRSINGMPDSGRWYWMIKIVRSSTAQPCTGIPLNARWVITAAHCTINETEGVLAIDYTANLGDQTEDKTVTAIKNYSQIHGARIPVKRIVKHPNSEAAKDDRASGIASTQNPATTPQTEAFAGGHVGVNDIALLELSFPLPVEVVNKTPPVNFNEVNIKPNLKATMAGYGDGYGTNPQNVPHYYSSTLRSFKKGDLKILTLPVKKKPKRGKVNSGPKRCKRLLSGNAEADNPMICDTGAPIPSNGDSGGPLVSNNMIIGTLYGGDTYSDMSFRTKDGAAVFEMERIKFEPILYHKHLITSNAGFQWTDHKIIPEGQGFSPVTTNYKKDDSGMAVVPVCRVKNADNSWSYGTMTKYIGLKHCRYSFYGFYRHKVAQLEDINFQVASGWENQNSESDAKIVWKKLHKKHLTPTSSSTTPIAIDFDSKGNSLYLCALISDEDGGTTHLENGEFGIISKQSKRCKIGNKAFRFSPNRNRFFWVLSIQSPMHQTQFSNQ
ncbi:trypsin-like serine protease [Endozoicomonas montiporae]|nr:trypsin-like serine protease [Endozoicomonas montiporae]